ncbi:hypothetical protein HOA92_02295 [archaeon]|jgi:hypothetical protein|nr:hypothetical protein [archaeon]MBT6761845.1 hypothetical protein [archaeon]
MTEKLEVKLSNQSFVEAGGRDIFSNLEIAGTVLAKFDAGECSGKHWNRQRVDQELDRQARNLNATYVFKVEYLFRDDERNGENLYGAVGTAYKPQE